MSVVFFFLQGKFARFLWLNLMAVLCTVIFPTSALERSSRSPGSINHEVVCQEQKLKIRCPNSSFALQIHGGSYGRTQSGDTVCPYAGSENDFYYNCGENDVTGKLKELCEKKKKCIFKVGKELFGDPCRGHAYLSMIYTCVRKKRKKKKNQTPKPHLTTTTWPTFNITTSSNVTANTTKSGLYILTTGNPMRNTSANSTGLQNNPVVLKRRHDNPGILISFIVWIFYVKGRSSAFMTVYFISIGASTFILILIYGILLIVQRQRQKNRERESANNMEAQSQKLNHPITVNGDLKRNSALDTLSNSFPAPMSTLPPPPDDMIYPSPSPDVMNAARPPPPPAHRGSSLDDISKIGQERKKNVELTRSLSMRTRPPDYYSKELNFDNFSTKLQPIVGCPDIHTVLRSKDSTMYMNPMYENGHMKECPC